MGRYRKVEVRIWNDEKFTTLSDQAKLAFLFVLTHPSMTSLGAMRATVPGMAAELRWKERAFRRALDEILHVGLLELDADACFLGIPRFLKHNPPESPNVVKSWESQLDLIPECDLKRQLLQRVKAFVESLTEGFREALPEVFGKGMANPEPYPEPYPEPELELKKEALPANGERGSVGKRRKVFDPGSIQIPEFLDTPEFRAAWGNWITYRREKRNPLIEQSCKAQLAQLSQAGLAQSVAAIRDSIKNGWIGLFPGEQKHERSKKTNGPGQAYDPARPISASL